MTSLASGVAGCSTPKKPATAGADPPATNGASGGGIDPALRESARREILAGARDRSPIVRVHALEAIAEVIGTEAGDVVIKAMDDPDPMVRFAAAMSAGDMKLASARDRLLSLLNDNNRYVKLGAIFALHRLGDTRFSRGLETALRDPDKGIRGAACMALGRSDDTSAVKVLKPVLKDPVLEVRLQAAEALWRLNDDSGLEFLVSRTVSPEPGSQMVALLALAQTRNRQIIGHIAPALKSEKPEVALVAARALGMLGADTGYDVAIRNTSAGDARLRVLAALALGSIAKPEAAVPLAAMLKDREADVQVAAATALLDIARAVR